MNKTKKITKKQIAKEKKKVERKLWKYVREQAIKRDKGCVICGDTKRINVHHLLPKEIKALKYELKNLICLCPKHHKYCIIISPHKNPFVFYSWVFKHRKNQTKFLLKYLKGGKVENE
jgi:hypothetical protein